MKHTLGSFLLAAMGWSLAVHGCAVVDGEDVAPFATLALEQLCPAIAAALCDARLRCECHDAGASSLCLALEEQSCEQGVETRVTDYQQTYDGALALQCVDQLEQSVSADCAAPVWPAACATVFSGAGPEGSPCTDDKQCLEPLECKGAKCRELPGDDEPCDPEYGCAAGYHCIGELCRGLPGDGEPCDPTSGCASDYHCIDGQCRPFVPMDEPCTASEQCSSLEDAYCAPVGSCATRAQLGQPCVSEGSPLGVPAQGSCADGLFCQLAATGGGPGTCQQRLAQGSCTQSGECDVDHYCNAGSCVERPELGGPCALASADEEIVGELVEDPCPVGSYCVPAQLNTVGICQAPIDSGECSTDRECAPEKHCERTCVALPGEGQGCTATRVCQPGLLCREQNEPSDGERFLCVQEPLDGAPCLDDPSTGGVVCPLGYYCSFLDFDAPACRPAPSMEAEPCDESGMCAEGLFCHAEGMYGPAFCELGNGEGAPCVIPMADFVPVPRCQPGLACDLETWTCVSAPGVDERCDMAGVCATGSPCPISGGTCVGGLQLGEPCDPPSSLLEHPECAAGYFCEPGSGSAGSCAPESDLGDGCDAFQKETGCHAPDTCAGELLCKPFQGPGSVCDLSAGCPVGYFCEWLAGGDVLSSPAGPGDRSSDETGICMPQGVEGEGCDLALEAEACDAGLWCAPLGGPSGQCIDKLPDGAECAGFEIYQPCLGRCEFGICTGQAEAGICSHTVRPF